MNPPPRTEAPSDRLLRTLAAVPVSSPVLDLGCGAGQHTEALLRLGFPVHACDPRPDAVRETRARVQELVDEETAHSCVQEAALGALDALDVSFDWVVASRPEAFLGSASDLKVLLERGGRLLEPGGWLYLTVPAREDREEGGPPGDSCALDDGGLRFSASDLDVGRLDTELAESRAPERVEENGEVRIHAIYRRVTGQVSA